MPSKKSSLEDYNVTHSLHIIAQCPGYIPNCSTCKEPRKCNQLPREKSINRRYTLYDQDVGILRLESSLLQTS